LAFLGRANKCKPNFHLISLTEERDLQDTANMDMANLISGEVMVMTPASPAMAVTPKTPGSPAAEIEGNTSPHKPPEVQRARHVKKPKRCLVTAFGERAFLREDSPDADPPALALTPRCVLPREEAEDKAKGPAVVPGRPRKKPCMSGGSSAHNSQAKTLERTLSMYAGLGQLSPPELSVATPLALTVKSCVASHEDIETLFSQGGCPSGLRTPPRSVVKLQMDLDMSPLQGLKLFDRFDHLFDGDEM
jgi:hypothetical protein